MDYQLPQDKVFEALASGEQGLSAAEAARRMEADGPNKLADAKKVPFIQRLLKQLADLMVIVLIGAAILSAITSIYAGESFADVIIILVVVAINTFLGLYQESKAEKAIDALKEISAATSKVLRDGHVLTLRSEELVKGDVVLLEAGDSVPADGRIIESASLTAEESALTGESVPVSKSENWTAPEESPEKVPLGDRKNMVYMGSTIAYGRGKAMITATGMDTQMGKIASAITNAKEEITPLQRRLNQLSKVLSFVVLGVCLFMFVFSLLQGGDFGTEAVLNTFMLAVSLAVAAIPEGLSAVVTVQLAIGVTRMAKRGAVIRKLTAVETLGCTQVICSDKTGTLTQNKMTVVDSFGDDTQRLATAMALCNDAFIEEDGSMVGEPTEAALVNFGESFGPTRALKANNPRIGEAPFDSGRKMMSTVHKMQYGEIVQFTKGAPDIVLSRCSHVLLDGRVVPLEDEMRSKIQAANKAMADRALRVLAAATRQYSQAPTNFEAAELEQNLVFLGLTGMEDPVRLEVKDAIADCKAAGIRPIMITGDHLDTAVAIAKQLGIIQSASQAITGAMLDDLSDEQLSKAIKQYQVYARVQPEHKVRIVNAWKANGQIVAMTGDGVNDAPSIKSADIGVGMGITGTDVTKNVADMVLTDDNFATIVAAVSEGRRIYDNIRKAIQFLLSSNISEVISIFTATMLGFTILKPIHILWINLITDTFPALALGMENAEADLMRHEPRSPKEGVFAGGLGADVCYQGAIIAAITLAAYFIGHYIESGVWEIAQSADGITMAFLSMSMAEIFHSFNMRSQRGSIFSLKGHNKFLLGSMLFSFVTTALVIYVPFLRDVFQFTHISLAEFGISMLLAISIVPIVECVKLVQRRLAASKTHAS